MIGEIALESKTFTATARDSISFLFRLMNLLVLSKILFCSESTIAVITLVIPNLFMNFVVSEEV